MKSVVAMTYELDSVVDAVRELSAQIKEKLSLAANSVGILYCDADADGASLSGSLKDELGIDIIGMTTLAALDAQGRQESAIVLMVLTSEDCTFSIAVSDSLRNGDAEEVITRAYRQSIPSGVSADSRPGLITVCCPCGMPFSGDRYPEILSQAAGDAPIIGGVASDDYDYKRARTFCSGNEYDDCMIILSFWGDIRPAFSIRHVTSKFAERIRRVTSAEGNVVHTVGNESFIDYLKSFGLDTNAPDPLLAFTSYPMMLTTEGKDEVPLMRHILSLDHATGSGSFVGDVPVGTLANICLISKDDVKKACLESISDLMETARKNPEMGYSTIFCISCCGRAMILGIDGGAEGEVLADMLTEDMSLAGAYCLGEICPVSYSNDIAVNRFHNCSITLCMI